VILVKNQVGTVKLIRLVYTDCDCEQRSDIGLAYLLFYCTDALM